jgi:hypothetical protein
MYQEKSGNPGQCGQIFSGFGIMYQEKSGNPGQCGQIGRIFPLGNFFNFEQLFEKYRRITHFLSYFIP